jgi:hypothetical protein
MGTTKSFRKSEINPKMIKYPMSIKTITVIDQNMAIPGKSA